MKAIIQQAINNFSQGDLKTTALNFFKALGYSSNKTGYLDLTKFLPNLDNKKALVNQWQSSHLLFQLADDDLQNNLDVFSSSNQAIDNTIMQSYIFAAIELNRDTNQGLYSKTELIQITRAINRASLQPVLLLFKHSDSLTLAVIHRRLHKTDSDKDVIEIKKVSLLKDININNPHRAHIDILFDVYLPELRKQYRPANFKELHEAWLKVFSIDKLNKRFYQDISNWYFWAITHVTFPLDSRQTKTQEETNSIAVIRLITRLIFVWFLKEKGLVPEHLFDKKAIDDVLNYTDKTGSTYYKAILQNLFFATLNTEMDSRAFVSNQVYQGKNKQHFLTNFYRYARFFKQPEQVLTLFNSVPFLNGGLFDCLDVEVQENGKKIGEIRVDYFSDNPKNESLLAVPDSLFFGDKTEVNLNAIYGTKNKRYDVRGLIPLLNAYKFTVTENTPLEEEIALDPELLGRIFENLLAAYNPETGITARKQTGSFYTPREIVDYMVDESLIAYFSGVLNRSPIALAIDEKTAKAVLLRDLLSYSELNNPFDEQETNALIQAIHTLKILDPACGSGAFPMGILHKLVFILRKLDKDNLYWRKIQEDKAVEETREAFKLGSHKERDERLAEISEVFEHNASDYGRKLFLIRDCIFGVDIQPIAIQIAKLRFFVSLVIEQKVDESKKNRGIEPLPNMEMKLIAANSLIGLDFKIAQGDIFYNPVRDLEDKIKAVRLEYFLANNRHKKNALKAKEQALLIELEKELINVQCGVEQAHKIIAWNPYNQNASADFFDKEFMFGLDKGFDIVIGNPPYGATYSSEDKKYFQANYVSAKTIKGIQKGSLDTFSLFIEQGFNCLKIKGNLNYIVPMAITSSDAMTGLHTLLEKSCKTISVSSYSNRPKQVFDNACIRTSILLFIKTGTKNEQLFTTRMIRRRQTDELGELIANLAFIDSRSVKLKGRYPKISTKIELAILQKLFSNGKPLIEFYEVAGNPIYYRTSGGRYFNVITNYQTGSTQEKAIQVKKELTDFVGSALSSNLFYFYQQVYSDGLHIKQFEIDTFSIPEVTEEISEKIGLAYSDYLIDIESNIINHQTASYSNISAFKEYKISKSKHLIDKLDDLICPLYGFTQAETDFIKNYEIEYRLSATVDD